MAQFSLPADPPIPHATAKHWEVTGEHVEVCKSSIPDAGEGLFTKEFLEDGTSLGYYTGRLLTEQEGELSDSHYLLTLTGE